VLHYALLAGATGESFSAETTNAVIKRMKQIRPEVSESKWEKILPECRIAFPEAWTFNVELPKDRFDSKLQCNELGKFLTRTLRKHHHEDPARAAAYAQMASKLDYRLEPGLRVRAGEALQESVRLKALAAAAKTGRSTQVMEQCVQRYG
jgi:tyrosyl-tRNA synthetase